MKSVNTGNDHQPSTMLVEGYRRRSLLGEVLQWVVGRKLKSFLGFVQASVDPRCRVPPGFAYDPNDHIGSKMLALGSYEAEEIQAISWLLRKLDVSDACMVDAGAHMGIYTVLLGGHFASVIAFEPNPKTYLLLRHNTMSDPAVQCRRVGLSDGTGIATIEVEAGNTGHSVVKPVTGEKAGLVTVAVDTLDSQLAKVDPGIMVKFLKMDVEGLELRVLGGAEGMINRCRPTVAFEYIPDFGSDGGSGAFAWLKGRGYRIFCLRFEAPHGRRFAYLLKRMFSSSVLSLEEILKPPNEKHSQLLAIPAEVVPELLLAAS